AGIRLHYLDQAAARVGEMATIGHKGHASVVVHFPRAGEEFLAGLGVPNPGPTWTGPALRVRATVLEAYHPFPVRAAGESKHTPLVSLQREDLSPGGEVPALDRCAPAGPGYQFAVGAEGHARHLAPLARKSCFDLAAAGVPHFHPAAGVPAPPRVEETAPARD